MPQASRAASRLAREEEANLLYDLAHEKLRAMWRELELFARMTKVPANEHEDLVTEAFVDFIADQLIDQDLDVRGAKDLMGEAMVDARKRALEEGVDVPEEEEEEDPEED